MRWVICDYSDPVKGLRVIGEINSLWVRNNIFLVDLEPLFLS